MLQQRPDINAGDLTKRGSAVNPVLAVQIKVFQNNRLRKWQSHEHQYEGPT